MNRKGIIMICLLLCFIISIQAASAADMDNATLTTDQLDTVDSVSEANDLDTYSSSQNNDVLTAGGAGNFTELQNLINNATGPSITLDKDYEFSDGDAGLINGIVISKNIEIIGNGHKLNGNNLSAIFSVTQGNVVLNNITFINGHSDTSAGAIHSSGDAALTISNCNFIDNHGVNAGAVHLSGDSSIDNCNFINNNATKDGGALFVEGDGCTVSNSTFTNNTAGDDGGAINW